MKTPFNKTKLNTVLGNSEVCFEIIIYLLKRFEGRTSKIN